MSAAVTATEPRWVALARVDDLRVGVFHVTRVADRELGVVRLADGEIRAVLNRCPHRGAPVCKGSIGGTWPPCAVGALQYASRGEVLSCPWHGWEFDLRSGRQLFQERAVHLKLFEVRVSDGIVEVTL